MPTFHSAWIGTDGTTGVVGSAAARFPWWSFTKTVLAICAMRLLERGMLDLDSPRPGRTYTLRQLLQHRAGVPDYGGLKAYHDAVARNDPAWPRQRLLDAVGGDRLDFAPGTGWAYSNVGTMFVREAIEEATGLPLARALETEVFAGLDLPSVRLATAPADFADIIWPKTARLRSTVGLSRLPDGKRGGRGPAAPCAVHHGFGAARDVTRDARCS